MDEMISPNQNAVVVPARVKYSRSVGAADLARQPRQIGFRRIEADALRRHSAASEFIIPLVAIAAAIGEAGIPLVEGDGEAADRKWPRQRNPV
jgi:hypothetical protein